MIHDSIDLNAGGEPRRSWRILLGVICALIISGALLVGYAWLRKRHAEITSVATPAPESPRKDPPKAKIIVDEPLLKGTETILGGRVQNISGETLTGLSIQLELRQRKDGELVESAVAVHPATLEPHQEGAYSVKMPAREYSSVKLIGLTGEPNSSQLAFTSAQGKQRPPERLEPKTIVITKRSSKGDQFLNSPDNPARVP